MAEQQDIWNEQYAAACDARLPHIVYRPMLVRQGQMYCAYYGETIDSGCTGFGMTPEKAMIDFDKEWTSPSLPIVGLPSNRMSAIGLINILKEYVSTYGDLPIEVFVDSKVSYTDVMIAATINPERTNKVIGLEIRNYKSEEP